jgi:hypothetical protein
MKEVSFQKYKLKKSGSLSSKRNHHLLINFMEKQSKKLREKSSLMEEALFHLKPILKESKKRGLIVQGSIFMAELPKKRKTKIFQD